MLWALGLPRGRLVPCLLMGKSNKPIPDMKSKLTHWFLPALAPFCGAVLFTACDVDQTEEGEMPEVSVEGGNMPEYDVDGPKVETGTKEIEVPTIEDVELPDDDDEAVEP